MLDDSTQLCVVGRGVGLDEDRADQRSDHLTVTVVRRRQHVAHRVNAAALPCSPLETAADRLDQAGIGERGQELAPEGLVLRVADIEPEDLTKPVSTQPGAITIAFDTT